MLNTIGYEKATLDDFLQTLAIADVKLLIDIRDRAQSRRKGFSKTALSEALAEQGIEYMHLRVLGDPKEGREAARSGDFSKFTRIYSEVLKTSEAQGALDTIAKLTQEKNVCLLCYERDFKVCHRKMVADKIGESTGLKARHLGVRQFDRAA